MTNSISFQKRIVLQILFGFFLFSVCVQGQSIPLKIEVGGAVGEHPVPLGCGIPLKEGQAKSVDDLAIEEVGKGLVPAQFEIRTRYDSGSILWLWIDFIGSPKGRYKLVFNKKNPAASLSDITVRDTTNEWAVNNGSIELIWNKTLGTPVKIFCVDKGSLREVGVGDGGGIYLIDNQNRKAILGGKEGGLEWKIETAGKIRVVLRGEGYYTTVDGEKIARAIVRYHIYRDQPSVRLEHTFIVTRDNHEVWYKEIGISMPLKEGEHNTVYFSDSKGKIYSENVKGSEEAWILQRDYPIYDRTELICELGRDKEVKSKLEESAGWSALDADSMGLALSVRDFAQQFPKEFCGGKGQLTAKLWSGRGGHKLDFNPKTIAEDWWKDWVNYANTEPYNKAEPDMQPENIRGGKVNPSCVGVARTHALFFSYSLGKTDAERLKEWDASNQKPALAYGDPAWICHVDSRAFWQMAARGEGGKEFEDIEDFISFWFDQCMMPSQHFRYTGFYDFGKDPYLGYLKTNKDGQVKIFASWYRLNLCNIYGLSKFLMIGWARSGDRKYLDAACHFTRFSSDNKFIHWDGGRDSKKKGQISWGGTHQLPHWRGNGTLSYGIDGDIITPLALLYIMRDERWAKDTLLLYRDAIIPFNITSRTDGGHPNVPLNHLMGIYRAFPSPELLAKIQALYNGFTDPQGVGGMSHAWFAAEGRSKGDYELYKINMKALSVSDYCDLFGTDHRSLGVLEEATKAACMEATHHKKDRGEKPWQQFLEENLKKGEFGPVMFSVCDYQAYHGGTASSFYRKSHKKEYYDLAKAHLQGIRTFWETYQKLPEQGKITSKFMAPPSKDSAPAPNAYTEPPTSWYSINFNPPTAGTAFFAMPHVIWMLKDYKEPEIKD